DEASRCIDELVEEEAMTLLSQGKSFELNNLRRQLLQSITGLARLLRDSGLEIVGVQVPLEGEWEGRPLKGSIDLVLKCPEGSEVILDLKWGSSTYQKLLASEAALQLAVYAAARQRATGAAQPPLAAYYSIAGGRLLATDAACVFGVQPRNGGPVAP